MFIKYQYYYAYNTYLTFFPGRMLRVVWFGLLGLVSLPPNKNWRLPDHDKFLHPKLNTPAIPTVPSFNLIPDVDSSHRFRGGVGTKIGHRPYYKFILHKRTPCQMICSYCGNQRWKNLCNQSNCDRNSRAYQVCVARKNAKR